MAPGAKFTEQAEVTRAGEGVLWRYTTAVSPTFKLPVPDPIAEQIGMIVMLKVSGNAPGAPARAGGGTTVWRLMVRWRRAGPEVLPPTRR